MAWAQKYGAKAAWIQQMLNAFFNCIARMSRDKYKTKLNERIFCNTYYIAALDYLQKRFKWLKTLHVVYVWMEAIHRYMCQTTKSAKISATKESLEVFVSKASCQQVHQSMCKKLDNVVLSLVLLPMNTTKNDVFCYVNEEVKKLIDDIELSVSSFQRL